MDWKLKATRSFAPVAAIIIWWARPLIWKSCNNILDLKPLTKEKKEKEKREKCSDVGLAEVDLRKLICLLACPLAVLSYVWIMTRVARLQTHILPLSLSLSFSRFLQPSDNVGTVGLVICRQALFASPFPLSATSKANVYVTQQHHHRHEFLISIPPQKAPTTPKYSVGCITNDYPCHSKDKPGQ